MKASKFSEHQIVSILQEQLTGVEVSQILRRHGISKSTFYKWKSKFGGMEVSDVQRLKHLERENSQLKKLVADLSLDNAILKEVTSKKW